MKRLIIFILLLFIYTSLYSQLPDIKKFEWQSDFPINPSLTIVQAANNDVLMFWTDKTELYQARSTDLGITWDKPNLLVSITEGIRNLEDLNALRATNSRILLTYKKNRHQLIYSDDNGISWSDKIELPTESGILGPAYIDETNLTEVEGSGFWFVYQSRGNLVCIKSQDGSSWPDERDTLVERVFLSSSGTVISQGPGSLILFYQYTPYTGASTIFRKTSSDGGINWTESEEILDTLNTGIRPRYIKHENKIWLFYQSFESISFENIQQSDILYAFSDDGGINWSEPDNFNLYVGYDGDHSINIINDQIYVVFNSRRNNKLFENPELYSIWYGIAGISEDTHTPPVIYDHQFMFRNNYPTINMQIVIRANDDKNIASAYFNYVDDKGMESRIQLFDDAKHDDGTEGDNTFSNTLYDLTYQYNMDYNFEITDSDSLSAESITLSVSSPFTNSPDVFAFDNNNLWLPINNKGVIADVRATSPTGEIKEAGRYENNYFLYSSGFALSGYDNGTLWANGVMSSSRLVDYFPGNVGSSQDNPLNKIYVLRSSHQPFTFSWLEWKDAVALGADFYDGDGDGLYNPIDLNGNGEWDTNEDRPDLLGDITAWCVYNDGVPAHLRAYREVAPLGIEIKQTMFSYDKETYPELSNVIFIGYNIENRGTVSDLLDSVYFGAWMDGDLGEYTDDLVGTDVKLNSTYIYNDGEDDEYGINPPAMFITLLQGPAGYIAGETYTDINGNGLYDENIDIALDTAETFMGPYIGHEYKPGATNEKITSGIHIIGSSLTQSEPDNEYQLRNYMKGYTPSCGKIDPCNWYFGTVYNEDCSSVNPIFMYSGDPVQQTGWINTNPTDQMQMFSTGPFVLEKEKPIEIIIAYVIGRGTDALNSITAARENVKDAIRFYETNFSDYSVGVKNNSSAELPTKFHLSQNYPNPFNPTTTIVYSIPQSSVIANHRLAKQSQEITSSPAPRNDNRRVTLKIYDILGREVVTLVDIPQAPGNYKVQFDGSRLSSGVYFYRLKYGNLIQSKKMILLR